MIKFVNIDNIKSEKYEGFVYNIEVEKRETKDDKFWVDNETNLITHNCFPDNMKAFHEYSKKIGYEFTLLKEAMDINESIR